MSVGDQRPRRDFDEWYQLEWPRLVATFTLAAGGRELGREIAAEALTRALERWDRVGDMASPGGWTTGLVDVHGDVLARGIGCRADSTCASIRVQNLTTNAQQDIPAPAGTTGWIPTAGESSRDSFSSDGRYLAVRAGGTVATGSNHPTDSQVYVVNLDTRDVKQVPESRTDTPFSRLVWSPDGRTVLYETTSHSTGAYRPSDATSTSFPMSCCGVAIAALPR